jgi:hypothetical protein
VNAVISPEPKRCHVARLKIVHEVQRLGNHAMGIPASFASQIRRIDAEISIARPAMMLRHSELEAPFGERALPPDHLDTSQVAQRATEQPVAWRRLAALRALQAINGTIYLLDLDPSGTHAE